ncbi:MAG: hypothetical protein ACFWT1_03355 [Selenomonas sp.]
MRIVTKVADTWQFQSTPLIRGATFSQSVTVVRLTYFNPRPSYEERRQGACATRCHCQISIHAPHTRSDSVDLPRTQPDAISIHAPHTRSDDRRGQDSAGIPISIHAPHTRSDSARERTELTRKFQSTPLIRGATILLDDRNAGLDISIHAPHTRSDAVSARVHAWTTISIHAPHTRSDHTDYDGHLHAPHFNPRPSYEERHDDLVARFPICDISIHAPHTRSDSFRGAGHRHHHISIHAPHTRSDIFDNLKHKYRTAFQSTPLIRGATREGLSEEALSW